MFTKKITVIFIISLVVVVGLSYWLGTKHSTATPTPTPGQFGGNRGNFSRVSGGQFGGRGGGVTGEIISFDGQTLTLKNDTGGGSRLVFLSTSTPITKTEPGSVDDLKPGQTVMVLGSPTTDGSIKAQTIQLRNR